MDVNRKLAVASTLVGAGVLVAGVALIYAPAGAVLAGLLLLAAGLLTDDGKGDS